MNRKLAIRPRWNIAVQSSIIWGNKLLRMSAILMPASVIFVRENSSWNQWFSRHTWIYSVVLYHNEKNVKMHFTDWIRIGIFCCHFSAISQFQWLCAAIHPTSCYNNDQRVNTSLILRKSHMPILLPFLSQYDNAIFVTPVLCNIIYT